MKKTRKIVSAFLTLILLAGCAQTPSDSISPVSPIENSDSTGISEDNITLGDNSTDSGTESVQQNSAELLEDATAYARVFAQYFREPVKTAVELQSSEYLYEFLLNSTFKLCQKNGMPLTNVSTRDWYEEYLISTDAIQEVSSLLLSDNLQLPECFFNDPNFEYQAKDDAFLLSPFAPPAFVTAATDAVQTEDGRIYITVSIARIEESPFVENTYVFQPIENEKWGSIYQLISIQ